MSKFTAGPWNVRTLDGSIANIDAADGTSVAQAFQVRPMPQDPTQEERKANACLIAAAPCLLAAAELALANLMRNIASEEATGQPFMGDDEHEAMAVLRAAIAKARGDA